MGRSIRSNQRGATMVIVVIAMTAMMGAAAFTIDLGAAWSLRRNLITATDASALAAAAEYGSGGNGCNTVDDVYLGYNAPGATLISCTPATTAGGGWVAVSAQQSSPAYFGRVLGLADTDVPSFSAAVWGPPSAGTGLRPFGLCAGTIQGGGANPLWLDQLNAYIASPTMSTVIEITYGKDAQTDPCNDPSPSSGSGNWGTLDLDDPLVCPPAWDLGHPCNGNPAPNPDLAYWTGNGYERPIQAGTPGQDCVSDAEHCWDGDTGADMNSGPVATALQGLVDLSTANDPAAWFVLPVFDWAEGQGGGTDFHIAYLVRVRLLESCFGGGCSPINPPAPGCTGSQCNWFLRLEFAPGLVTGVCCGPPGSTPGVYVTALCAVDPTDTSGC